MTKRELLAALRADKNVPQIEVEKARRLLKEAMPRVDGTIAGRMRLTNAMRYKFGENFRSFEAVDEAMREYEGSASLLRDYVRVKGGMRG